MAEQQQQKKDPWQYNSQTGMWVNSETGQQSATYPSEQDQSTGVEGASASSYGQARKDTTSSRKGLDPNATYKIRFTFVRSWFQERYAHRMNQKSQTIYADDHVLAEDVELPFKMSDFFTYEIPHECTHDGELIIRFERAADVARGDRAPREQWRNAGGWGTLVSEAWLMKR